MTRTARPDFAWSDLIGHTVLAPGIGGSAPYAFTAGLVRESGVDPTSITWLRDLSTPMYVELFEAGLGDAIVLDLVNAEAMQHRGTGVIVNDYTRTGGLGPNSVYYCHTDRLEELSERLVAFTAALGESMQLLKSVNVADVRPLLDEHWPTTSRAVLSGACTRMLNSHTWDTPRIDQVATERWMRTLFEENMVRSQPAFSDVVDTVIIDAAESAAVSV
jgi:NitT/TauT family transport system substrate-binding protein